MPKGSGAGGNAAGVIAGKLYVFGGEYFHDGGKVHAEVWAYDPKTDVWEAAAPKSLRRLLAHLRLAPKNRRASLRRNDRVNRVLKHQNS